MTTELVQAWRFVFLVGVGFLSFGITLRYWFHDRRDGVHVMLTLIGAAIVLLANRSIETSNGTSAFLVLIGGGTALFLLGALVTHLIETVVLDPPPE